MQKPVVHAGVPALVVPPENRTTDQAKPGLAPRDAIQCPLPAKPRGLRTLTPELCDVLEQAGCPLVAVVQERLGFETLLAELSATFVNLPADQVDSQIEAALRRLVGFLRVDRGGLAELLADRKQLVITHSYHLPGVPPQPRTVVDEQLPWYARAIYRGEVIRLRSLPDDLPPEAAEERAYCLQVGLKSHVMIPLRIMDAVVGAVGFASFRASRDWPDDLIQRLRLVGEIFTNAVARKRAEEALRAREQSLRQTREGLRKLAAKLLRAQEEERRRIAREMHDDWTQRLALLGIDIAKLERYLGAPEKALLLLHAMQEQLVRLSEDVHALSRQLHPSILDDLGLVEALRSECASLARREGIAVDYRPEAVPATLPKDVVLCVYRVAQEALRNLVKHAAVKEAWVSLGTAGPELVLRVRDEGVGFDPASVRAQPGLGLSSMEERVRLIQAELAITSAPGHGTSVEVRIPLARSDP
jgi:signal transduction histidine kinase